MTLNKRKCCKLRCKRRNGSVEKFGRYFFNQAVYETYLSVIGKIDYKSTYYPKDVSEIYDLFSISI